MHKIIKKINDEHVILYVVCCAMYVCVTLVKENCTSLSVCLWMCVCVTRFWGVWIDVKVFVSYVYEFGMEHKARTHVQKFVEWLTHSDKNEMHLMIYLIRNQDIKTQNGIHRILLSLYLLHSKQQKREKEFILLNIFILKITWNPQVKWDTRTFLLLTKISLYVCRQM